MRGFVGGRDRGRTPNADPAAERANRLKALTNNVSTGVEYDRNGRLRISQAFIDRLTALEAALGASTPGAVGTASSTGGQKSFASGDGTGGSGGSGDTKSFLSSGGGSAGAQVVSSPTGAIGVKNIRTVTASTQARITDEVVVCDATAGAVTVTLVTAVGNYGRVFYVKKVDSSANAVTIDGKGSELVDGSATFSWTRQYQAITVISDGAQWWIV